MTESLSRRQIGYAILKKASEPAAKRMSEAIDYIAKNMSKENSEVLARAFKTLQEGYENKEQSPYTDKFIEMTKKWFEEEFSKDMIYYSICYDHFRM